MGFSWGSLLNNIKTGGDLVQGVGNFFSGSANAAGANRSAEDARNLTQDQLRLRIAEGDTNNQGNRIDYQLKQQDAARTAQTDAYNKALRSAMAMNFTPTFIDRSKFKSPGIADIHFTTPAMRLGAEGKAAAEELNRQAMLSLMNPPDKEPLPTYTAPELSTPTEAGFWEKLAGPVGAGLRIGGSILSRRAGGPGTGAVKPIAVGGGFSAGDATA